MNGVASEKTQMTQLPEILSHNLFIFVRGFFTFTYAGWMRVRVPFVLAKEFAIFKVPHRVSISSMMSVSNSFTTCNKCRTTVTLSNGVEMPILALGTAPLSTRDNDTSNFHPLNSFHGFLPEQVYQSIYTALEMNNIVHTNPETAGDDNKNDNNAAVESSMHHVPVHIDTAIYYRTHPHIRQALGNAFATGKKKRSDVFLTTKVFHPNFGDAFSTEDLGHCMPLDPKCQMTYDDAYSIVYHQFQQSLYECGVGYFDLVLLHWPGRKHSNMYNATRNAEHRLAAWNVLEYCYSKGWARAIGVSNFSEHHLEELQRMNETVKKDKGRSHTTGIKSTTSSLAPTVRPQVNQIEASVFLQHSSILEYCRAKGIVTTAYSPLGRGVNQVTTNKIVQSIATKHGKDAGQIALKYLLQKGYGCIVFWTTNVKRVRTNHQLHDFDLDETEIAALDALNRWDGTGTWGVYASPYDIP